MGNTGNMGMGNMGMGNMGMGNMGSNGGAGSAFFADRVQLPFVTSVFRSGIPLGEPPVDIPCFRDQNWAAEYYAWLVLTQFVKTEWANLDEAVIASWTNDTDESKVIARTLRDSKNNVDWTSEEMKACITGELNGLIIAARDERADALDETVSQHDEFASYFLNLLSASRGYPATAKLLTIVSFIAGFCGMYFKGKYRRPRPSMLCPALLPPLSVPGHASFPSGHSTQAHLMALCLQDVLVDKAFDSVKYDLVTLADRIARNREIAGLHYPSDSEFGKRLAPEIKKLLIEPLPAGSNMIPADNWYAKALEAARAEWRS